MHKFFWICCFVAAIAGKCYGQIINTIAGTGITGSSGDGGIAVDAKLNWPSGVAKDNAGNIYITDRLNHKIRKIGTDGIITTIAGTGTMGFTGNGGQASIALLNNPLSITTDASGNTYFTELGTFRIRKIATNGIISIFAGTGVEGFSGDGAQATAARLSNPGSLSTDIAGNLFFVDGSNYRIRKISTSGIITTIAGNAFQSFSGDGGQAVNAFFRMPTAVEADPLGNIYIADNGNHRIRKIAPSGIITTVAGNNNDYYAGDGVSGTSASFGNIFSLASDASGNLLITDGNRIRKLSTAGIITTIAGTGVTGFAGDGGSPLLATLAPGSIDVATDGKILIGDVNNHRIRRISFDLVIASISPTSANLGQQVTITGGNFTGAYAVSFGGVHTSFTLNSSTSITATIGSGATGNVTVTTPLGTAMLRGFTYSGPAITSVAPISGVAGNIITITGANLSGATAVKFGGTPAASFTVVNATTITAVLAVGTSGNVSVTTPTGTATQSGFFFTGPTITNFTPTTAGPGANITILGTNLSAVTAVSFGGVPAASFTANAYGITAVTGNGASGNVSVTAPNGTAVLSGFNYVGAPVVSSFSPAGGGTGNTITITGLNFTGANAVKFGGVNAGSFTVVNPTTITAVIGTSAITGSISVTTPGGTATRAGFTFYPAPIISTISPIAGGSGTVVSLTGYNFTNASAVKFGAVNAASFNVVSPTSATAVVGSGASGSVSITTPGGTISASHFTFVPSPVISSISPASNGKDSTVTIIGTNFNNVSSVKFGGVNAASYTVVNSTTINAKLGTGASGNITVTTTGGTASFSGFTFIPPPVITSFSPVSAVAGSTITITGTNLSTTHKVMIGVLPAASFTVINNTTVRAVVGTGASGAIEVTTKGGMGSLAGFTFIPAPFISAFYPVSAGQGTTVTLSGIGFSNATAVSFGGTAATSFAVVNSSQITAVVGNGTSGTISITAPGGTATKTGFSFIQPPVISSFTPNSAITGQTITITGTNFTGASAVRFGGTNATSVTIVNATTIIAIVGAGTSGNVSVTTPGGTANKSGFTFLVPPAISSFTPTNAAAGTTVTLTGTHFTNATAVLFGGTPASSFTVVNATTITAVVGVGTSGNILVETPGGIGSIAGFTYLQLPPPVITSFSPLNSGAGLPVVITGTNLATTNGISFGGTPAVSFVVNNASTVTAIVGAGSSGNVSLTTPSGTAAKAGFTYTNGPSITSFSPAMGASGSVVTITGTNFTDITYVKFGTANATTFTVVNVNTITAVVGDGASGSVSVTSPAGIGSKTGFSFIPAPVISAVSPSIIGQGDEVLITGSNFTNVNTVSLGGILAASFTVVSPTQIKAIAGTGSSGVVSVTTPGGIATRDGVFYTRNLCPGTNTIFTSEITGSSYRWQVNTGSGFTNISNNIYYSGATTVSLQLTNAPSSFYGYQYRCNVNGKYSKTILIRFANTWTGAVNTLWNNSGNWGCTTLPDSSSNVKINSGVIAVNLDTTIRSLLVKPGVNFTVQAGKKLKISGKEKRIEKVALAPAEVLLYANTSGLIMLPGEQAVLTIRQLTNNAADSIPAGLTYASSDASIATFGSDGKVMAKQTGICKVTATNAQGKKITIQVAVLASGAPLINEPVFVGLDAPLLYINTANLDKVNAKALNRLGQPLPDPVKIVFRDNQLQQAYNANGIINTEDGLYILTATAGEKMLFGAGAAVVYKNMNSTVLGEWSPAVLATAVINPPVGIYSVVVEWGKYPLYFTKAGVTSEPVNGLVYRMVPYEIMSAGVPTGAYGITISTSEENVNVETENETVVKADGTTLISVKEGLGRWRVVHDNYIGPWYSSQVFADFSGDWYAANDNTGKNIKLRIPEVDPQVIYGGTIGNSLNIYQQYNQNTKSIAWAQANLGTGQRKDNATGTVSSPITNEGTCEFKVEIGPMPDCLICNIATVPQRPGWGFGFLTLQNQGRFGSMIYASPTRFYFSEIGNNGRDILFVKQPIYFSPSLASFSPASSAPGGAITLKVCNANLVTGVSFGGVPATNFSVINNSTITAIVGQGNSGVVKISSSGGESSLGGFTIILPAPTITSFSPTSASAGTTVTISGTYFTNATAVGFGGIPAASFKVVNANTIEAIVPVQGLSGNVTVKTPPGETSKSGFVFIPQPESATGYFRVSNQRGLQISYHDPTYKMKGLGPWWSIKGDSTSAFSMEFHGKQGEEKPTVGTYMIGDYSMGFSYKEEGSYYNKLPTIPQGSVTITRADSRCVGTFTDIKIYILYTNYFVIISGSFDIPLSQ